MSHPYQIEAKDYRSPPPPTPNAKLLMSSFNALPDLFGKKQKQKKALGLTSSTSISHNQQQSSSSNLEGEGEPTNRRALVWDGGARRPGTRQEQHSSQVHDGDKDLAIPITLDKRGVASRAASRQEARQRLTQSRGTMRSSTPSMIATSSFVRLQQPSEGLLKSADFQDRTDQQYSNLFPTSKEKETFMQSTTKTAIKAQTSKPEFLSRLELKIEAELTALKDHGGSSNARARLYLEAIAQLGTHLPTYQPLLTSLRKEMEDILLEAETSSMKAAGAKSDFQQLKSAYVTDVTALKEELTQTEVKMKEELDRIDHKQKERSMVMLIYDVEELQRQLVEAKSTIHDLRDKLTATNRVRAEFERTMRSIEDTFNLISDEKDLQISKLRTEAAMEHAESVSSKRRAHEEITQLLDRLDTVTIAHRVGSQQNKLLGDRCKDLEAHLNAMVQQLQTVEAERDAMEERLAAFEGNPGMAIKNPTTTPRPSKQEATKRIPALGDIAQFGTTQAMMAAIYELYDQMKRKADDWEGLFNDLDRQVENRWNERQDVEAERKALERMEKRRLKKEKLRREGELDSDDEQHEGDDHTLDESKRARQLSIASSAGSGGSDLILGSASQSFFCGAPDLRPLPSTKNLKAPAKKKAVVVEGERESSP